MERELSVQVYWSVGRPKKETLLSVSEWLIYIPKEISPYDTGQYPNTKQQGIYIIKDPNNMFYNF